MPGYPMSPRTRLESLVVRAATSLPPAALRAAAGPPIVLDGQTLEPEVQMMLRLMEIDPRPNMEDQSPADARASIRSEAASVAGRPLPLAEIRETTVEGAAGPLRARLHVPRECSDDPASGLLVGFHGGGWVVGDLDSHDAPWRLLARTAGVRVLAVDYRLAPEHRFPAAADDAYAAFLHVHENAASFGADPDRIAVGGDSAGGNVSAACALRAAREGGPAPAFQLLVYPVTDNSRQDRRSYELFGEGFFLTDAHMRWYRGHYFGADEATLSLDPAASPLLAEDLSGVAPAHVVTAGFDPLRDEGEEYAERLREAGVPVTQRRHPGLIHGFFNAVGAGRASRDAVAEMGGVLRAGLSLRAGVRAG